MYLVIYCILKTVVAKRTKQGIRIKTGHEKEMMIPHISCQVNTSFTNKQEWISLNI